MKTLISILTITLIAAATASATTWTHIPEVDIMTDKDTSMILGDNGSRDGAIVVRCNGANGYDVYAAFEYLGSSNTQVIVRFDQEEPRTLRATSSTSGYARFFQGSDKDYLIDAMKRHNRLIVRATKFNGSPATEVYELRGFTAAVNNLNCVK